MTQPLRFIHSSDWHLERPVAGLTEIPDHLRELLLEAPFGAARRIFDAAVAEHVDFVLLAGDVVEAALAGPRSVLFLIEQFERLAQRNIAVYWAMGPAEIADDWLASVSWPANVHRFAKPQFEPVELRHGDRPAIRVAGCGYRPPSAGRLADFHLETSLLPTVAVGYVDGPEGETTTGPWLSQPAVGYWALGGQHQRGTLQLATGKANYAGTPQGRSPGEAGAHGCCLVTLDDAGHFHSQFLPCDVIRWQHEEIAPTDRTSGLDSLSADALPLTRFDELGTLLRRRAEALQTAAAAESHPPALLVHWTVDSGRALWQTARRSGAVGQLVDRLRIEFGHRAPPIWTTAIELRSPEIPLTALEQKSLLGDFLRLVERCQQGEEPPLELEGLLSERQRVAGLPTAIDLDVHAGRQRILHEAALLGAELLGGEPADSLEAGR